MNQYGNQALDYWRAHRPDSYAGLADPLGFFRELGERVAAQVDELAQQLYARDPAPAGESEADNQARRAALRRQAEEVVLAELVFLPPEQAQPGFEDDPEPTADERELAIWQDDVIDRLIAGRMDPGDLTAQQLLQVRQGQPARLLELAGLGDDQLHERGLLP